MNETITAVPSSPGLGEVLRQPAARTYLLIGFAALIVYYTQMSERGGEIGAALALLVALPGLAARWVISPALFLILTTYLLIDPEFGYLLPSYDFDYRGLRGQREHGAELRALDIVLATAILLYFMCQFRLLSLTRQSMPDDPPPQRKGQPERIIPRRPAGLFANREIEVMFVLAMIYIATGALIWLGISRYERTQRLSASWGIEPAFVRLMLFGWLFISGSIIANVAFRYLALCRMNRKQARLILQDMFWLETRREQERIYHWRHWYNNK